MLAFKITSSPVKNVGNYLVLNLSTGEIAFKHVYSDANYSQKVVYLYPTNIETQDVLFYYKETSPLLPIIKNLDFVYTYKTYIYWRGIKFTSYQRFDVLVSRTFANNDSTTKYAQPCLFSCSFPNHEDKQSHLVSIREIVYPWINFDNSNDTNTTQNTLTASNWPGQASTAAIGSEADWMQEFSSVMNPFTTDTNIKVKQILAKKIEPVKSTYRFVINNGKLEQ